MNNLKNTSSRNNFISTASLSVLGLAPSSLVQSLNGMQSSISSKKLVRIFLPGGLSQLDSFDPKPENSNIMGDTKVIKGNTGEQISAYFPELAKRMDKFSVIRSMSSSEADHDRARYLNETSYPVLGTIKHPDLGAWLQKLNGPLNDTLPSSVAIGAAGNGGYLGPNYDPFKVGRPSDPLNGLILDDPTSKDSTDLLKMIADVQRDFHKKYNTEHVAKYRNIFNESIAFMRSDSLSAFDINHESKSTLNRYNIPGGDKLLLALRLLEANVQYISISLFSWDNHSDLWESFPDNARKLDKALALFIDDLQARGLYDNTIFAVSTDFGRPHRINDNKGRDHNRKCFANLLGGAGVKNGIIYGQTDDYSAKVIENPVTPADMNATLAKLMGINLNKEIFSPDNRPFTVARDGKPSDALII